METPRPPEVVREKKSRLGSGRASCVLVFGREFAPHEISRFYAVRSDDGPASRDFEVEGRVIRYECPETDEARWRLAVEILLVKSFRMSARRRPADSDTRPRPGSGPFEG